MPSSGKTVGFIAFIDAVERIDTLLLEYRHTQVNLIHFLRTPELYDILRDEEDHIWNSVKWGEELRNGVIKPNELVKKWIFDYQDPEDYTKNTELNSRYIEYWRDGYWSLDQKRHYRILCALQQIKKSLVKDRIIICWWGLHTFQNGDSAGGLPDTDESSQLGRFMTLRAAIIYKTYDYVQRLSDLQAQLERSLDMGFQDALRPSLSRRREQGIYTAFLADRCRDISTQISILLEHQYPSPPKMGSSGPIMHRWTHDFTSRSFTVGDEPGGANKKHTSFINSSFWMTERPDLQSVLAHEVAHITIKYRYRNANQSTLEKCDDPFGRLLRVIAHCIQSFQMDPRGEEVRVRNRRSLVREIACDLLAATVEGHAYLLALFEEISGGGLEVLFDTPAGTYDLELAHYLEQHGGYLDRDREWYLRLRVTSAWLKAIHHIPSGSLDNTLTDGVEEVMAAMLRFLDNIRESSRSTFLYWTALGDRLCRLVEESDAAETFCEWRGIRSKDDRSENDKSAPWRFPRFARRLPGEVRSHLFGRMLIQKAEDGHPLCGSSSDERRELFFEYYNLDKCNNEKFPPLFQHIYDIPWQCMIIRAFDFLGSPNPECDKKSKIHNSIDWLTHLQCHTALGREFYQVALEFYYDYSRSAYHHLHILVRLLTKLTNSGLSSQDVAIKQKLDGWLDIKNGESEPHDQRIKNFVGLINKDKSLLAAQNSSIFVSFLEDQARNRSAKYWHDLWVHFSLENVRRSLGDEKTSVTQYHTYRRTLEKIIRRKLCDLANIFSNLQSSNIPTVLSPLMNYLSASGMASVGNGNKRGDRNRRLINAFASNENTSLPGYYQISRIAISGRYTQSESSAIKDSPLAHLFSGNLKHENSPLCTSKATNSHGNRYSQPVLGRYDIVSWTKTRPMCRCTLPSISSSGGTVNEPRIISSPFFVRREQAIPIRIFTSDPWPADETPVLAIIAITLTQRNARLDVVSRLLKSVENRHSNNGTYQLDRLGGVLNNNDRLFLSDGWGDLLLFLSASDRNNEKGLLDAFKIQGAFFEDFMVDRTELILTPACISIAAESTRFHLSAELRLVESRELRPVNQEVVQRINDNLKKSSYWSNHTRSVNFCRIPGRTDYHISYKHPLHGLTPKDFYDIFNGVDMDTIETSIGLACNCEH